MTTPPSPRNFWSVASGLRMLTAEVVPDLVREAEARAVPASRLVVEKGLMDFAQVDIVEMLLRPEACVPGYEIEDVLGYGGMGVVYRCRQKALDRVVAVKTVLLSQLGHSDALPRFEREARILGSLRHPNIVAAFDFGRCEGRMYFVMEFVEGENLEQYIGRQGRLSEATAWGLARQAAAGLYHADQAGVVHRDIKPSNLLLVTPPEGFPLPPGLPMVKVTDFGLAFLDRESEEKQRLTASGIRLGTPHYMAVEQYEGRDVDRRADIYSLGATVYHMVAGSPPFSGKNVAEVMFQIARGQVTPLREAAPDVSEPTADLVSRMMARDPANRVPDYRVLLADMDRVLAGLGPAPPSAFPLPSVAAGAPDLTLTPTRTHGAEKIEASPKPRAGTRRWALAGAAAAALAGGILTFALWPDPRVAPEVLFETPGQGEPLFQGTHITDWRPLGSAFPDMAAETGNVFRLNGWAIRPLERLVNFPGGLPPNYRVEIDVDLHLAKAAEIHFGMEPAAGARQDRFVVRITAGEAALGIRRKNEGALEPLGPPRPYEKAGSDSAEGFLHVEVQRHERIWRVIFNQEELGRLPFSKVKEIPEVRLKAEGGEARFANIQIVELLRRPPPPPKDNAE